MKDIIIFSDGSCLGNPGSGGWAAILRYKDVEKIIKGGFAYTTNNRMEITACLEALRILKDPCNVNIFTDSRYVVDSVSKGWLDSWQKNGWINSSKKAVKNRDLWEELLPFLEKHRVSFNWIRGHQGHPENERCDILAKEQALRTDLPCDPGADI